MDSVVLIVQCIIRIPLIHILLRKTTLCHFNWTVHSKAFCFEVFYSRMCSNMLKVLFNSALGIKVTIQPTLLIINAWYNMSQIILGVKWISRHARPFTPL